MPAKSKAQFRKMFILYKQGKITKKELDDFTASGDKGLPEHTKKSKQKTATKPLVKKHTVHRPIKKGK